MIYFDNAASGGFKCASVYKTALYTIKNLSVNTGRGSHKKAVEAEKIFYSARKLLSKYVNNGSIAKLIFTSNCTEALNFAIFGMGVKGGNIVSTVSEHNSVLRPLYHLEKEENVELRFAPLNEKGLVDAQSLLSLIDKNTRLVVMNAVSNVTGAKNEFEKVGQRLNGQIPFIVDGAQGGGHIPFDMKRDNISALCLAGHKGLFALQGVGVLALKHDVELTPVLYGGSGGDTFEPIPLSYPEKEEAGTGNLPAVASILEGAKFAIDNLEYHNLRLNALTERMIEGLEKIDGVTTYSRKNPFGICAFSIRGVDSMKAADIYSEYFDVALRSGFHCAPLMHKSLKTADNGLIRASLSPFNTEKEVDVFLSATAVITKNSINI